MSEAAPVKRLTLQGFSDNEHLDGYNCFVVEITWEYATKLLGLMKLVAGLQGLNPEIYQLRIWDYTGDWYDRDYDREDESIEPRADAEPLRTECDILHVSDDSVEWTAIAKYTDCECRTEQVTRTDIEAIQAELRAELDRRREEERQAAINGL